MSDFEDIDYLCPRCNSEVNGFFDCHTWPGHNGVWMSCIGCSSAIHWYCMECDWSYTEGLSKGNPRSIENEENRPPWVPTKEIEWT
jgi:hypothetical protein